MQGTLFHSIPGQMKNGLLFVLVLGFLVYGLYDLFTLVTALEPHQLNTLVLLPKLVKPLAITGGSGYLLYMNFFRSEPGTESGADLTEEEQVRDS